MAGFDYFYRILNRLMSKPKKMHHLKLLEFANKLFNAQDTDFSPSSGKKTRYFRVYRELQFVLLWPKTVVKNLAIVR